MCQYVDMLDGRHLASRADLKAAFEVTVEDLNDEPDWVIGDECCLCGVNIEAVLSRAGVRWAIDEHGYSTDPFGYQEAA